MSVKHLHPPGLVARLGTRSARAWLLAALLVGLFGSLRAFATDAGAPPLLITEFMAVNSGVLHDEDGDSPDWIELYNNSAATLNLGGWYLSDLFAVPGQWALPPFQLEPGKFLIVFASGKNRTNVVGRLHTNFKLDADGEFLGLARASANGPRFVQSFWPFPPQNVNASYGLRMDGSRVLSGEFPVSLFPTPAQPNPSFAINATPGPVQFSRSGGMFTAPFSLTLSNSMPGAPIRYLLVRNAQPAASATNLPAETSPLYTGPIWIDGPVEVRTRAFPPVAGPLPGPPHSETFLPLGANLVPFVSSLPLVVVHTRGAAVLAAEGAIDASVEWFDNENGYASLTNRATPIRASVQWLASRTINSGKPSLAIELKDELGQDLEVPVLGLPKDSDWVLYAPNSLGAGSFPSFWNDPLAHQLSRDLGHYAPRTRFVELFLDTDGQTLSNHYAGVYVLEEKIKRGKDRVDIDKLTAAENAEPEITGGYLLSISTDRLGETQFIGAGRRMNYHYPSYAEMTDPSRAAPARYLRSYFGLFSNSLPVAGALPATGTNHYSFYFDVDAAVDYHLVNVLACNELTTDQDVYLFKPRSGPITMGPVWSFDSAFGTQNRIGSNPRTWPASPIDFFNPSSPQSPWWVDLFRDRDFFQRWIDRYQELRDSQWQTNALAAWVDRVAGEMREAQPRDQARWPANRPRAGVLSGDGYTNSFDGTYTGEVEYLKRRLFDRLSFMDTQFLGRPLIQLSGLELAQVTIQDRSGYPGTRVYYTLDGSDPRLPQDGTNSNAQLYTGPIQIQHSGRVVARAVNRSSFPGNLSGPNNPPLKSFWSGKTEQPVAGVPVPTLRLTELMYHPPAPPRDSRYGRDEFQFIELKNFSPFPVRLGGCRFTSGFEFTFPSMTLAPQAYVVVVKNRAAFASRYGTNLLLAGEFVGTLAAAGERLRLVDLNGSEIFELAYDDRWYPLTDGPGLALVPVEESTIPGQRADWQAGRLVGGSPGRPEPNAPPVVPVVINELLSNPEPPYEDVVELYNPTSTDADIGYWYLTDDDSEPRKFQIPPGTVLSPFGYWAFDEHAFNPFSNPPLPTSFSFNANGDEVYLYSANASGELTGYVHGFRFGPAATNVAFGRVVTPGGDEAFLPQAGFSFAETNLAPRAFAGSALQSLHVTELMYAPGEQTGGSTNEFLELHNAGDVPLDLTRVELTGAIRFTFPNWVLQPGAYVLVIRDPQLFTAQYGSNLPVAGVYSGAFSSAGEELVLTSAQGELIRSLGYSSVSQPLTLHGGFSLVLDERGGWRPSTRVGGSPGVADPPPTWVPVVINEVMAGLTPAGFVELYNPNDTPAPVGLWTLLWGFDSRSFWKLPPGTIIPPKAFQAFQFSFSFLDESEMRLQSANPATGEQTGYAHRFLLGAFEAGTPFGRHLTSDGREVFPASATPTPGATNAPPKIGPLILSEIHATVPNQTLGTFVRENLDDQYVELLNLSADFIPLSDGTPPWFTWGLRGSISYAFPPGAGAPPNGTLLVVGFDPSYAPAAARFRARNNVPSSVPLYGPWSGELSDQEATVELVRPVPSQLAFAQVDVVHYLAFDPWPSPVSFGDELALSLHRIAPARYGDDPASWRAGAPNAGVPAPGGNPPLILTQPQSQSVLAGNDVTFRVSATGDAPLFYLWRRDGTSIPGATNSTLTLHLVQPSQAGSYTVLIADPAGAIESRPATLTVNFGLLITRQPTNVFVRLPPDPAAAPSTNAVFEVAASGISSVTYQWRFNGTNLPGATNATLIVSNVSLSDEGFYSCGLTDLRGTVYSAPARLAALITPQFTLLPLSQTVPSGANVTVSAAVSGHPPPFQFEWRSISAPQFTNVFTQPSNTCFWTFPAPPGLVTDRRYRVVVRNEVNPIGIAANFSLTTLLDTDGDGLPDEFEAARGLDPANPLDAQLDTDGDGLSNHAEYLAGTDPLDPLSYLRIEPASSLGGTNAIALEFFAVSNRTYTVEFQENAPGSAWSRFAEIPAHATNRVVSLADPWTPGTDSHRRYRLVTPHQP